MIMKNIHRTLKILIQKLKPHKNGKKRWTNTLPKRIWQIKHIWHQQWDSTVHLLQWHQHILVRIWSNGNSHSLLVEMQNGTATLEVFGSVLPKQTYSYHIIQQPCSLVFTQKNWKGPQGWGMMAHAYGPSTWETGSEATWIIDQPGLHSEDLSQKKKLSPKKKKKQTCP
jgi:hypothetical protein